MVGKDRVLTVVTGLVFLVSLPLTYSLDPDFGWHLALGRYMYEQGRLVHTLVGYNVFSNLSLIDHEWLSHLLIYPVYRYLGYPAMVGITVFLLWSALWLFVKIWRANGASSYSVLLTAVMMLTGVVVTYGVRLQVLFLPAIGLLMYLVEFLPSFPRRLLWYFGIFAVGNNLHGGFLLLAIIPLCLEWDQVSERGWKAPLRRVALVGVVILLALACNPYGLQYVALIGNYLTDASYKKEIIEWLPIFLVRGQASAATALFLASLGLGWLGMTVKRLKLGSFVMIMVWAYLGMSHIRFLPLFLFVVSPYIVRGFTKIESISVFGVDGMKRATYGLVALWMICQVALISWPAVTWPNHPERFPDYPSVLMEAVEGDPSCRTGLLNAYNWGGYMAGFYPNTQVFVDGRGPQLKVNGQSLLDISQSMLYQDNPNNFQSKLDYYQIDCVLLKKSHTQQPSWLEYHLFHQRINQNKKARLQDYLASSKEWQKAAEDDLGTVYVRHNSNL